MNEYLEQLVRDLTNAYSRSQRMFGERISPGPANQRSFPGLPCCWGASANKATSPDSSVWLCSVSLPISVFFYALASWCPSQRTRDNSKRRGLIACVFNTYGKLLSPNHLWSLPGALNLTYLHVSTRGLFQDMMFDRLLHSTLSEDASEVLVQPLHCGIEKANSMTRVVVKPTPRLCSRCASNT